MLLNNRKQISKNFVWTFQSTTVTPPKQKRGDHLNTKNFKQMIELAATNQTIVEKEVEGAKPIKVFANDEDSKLGLGKEVSQRNHEDNKKIAEDEANRWAVTRWIRSSLNINPKFKTYEESEATVLKERKQKAQETGIATNSGTNDKEISNNNG